MNTIFKHTYIWLVLLGAMLSCQDRIEIVSEEPQLVVFKSFLKEGNQVTPITRVLGIDLTEGYLLGGAWTTGPFLTNDKIHFYAQDVDDRMMQLDGSFKDPNAPKIYWNTNGKIFHTFYAYTANPAETPTGFGVTHVRKFLGYTASNSQGVCLLFRQPDDPAKHIDLLVADNSNIVVSPGATSAVNLYFQHRLSKISIKVFGTGGANITSCQAKVTYGTTAPLHGIGGSSMAGVFIVKNSAAEYEFQANRLQAPRHIGTYNLGHQFTVTNTQASEIDAVLAGSMIFIPQPLATDGWATITLEYSIDGSVSRYTAKVDMPAIAMLSPTKEYIFALNLIERSSVLTVANVMLVDWNSKNEIIDNMPGEYSLILSATKPPDVQIPALGAVYNINVVSNRSWMASKIDGVTVTPSTGTKGTTNVTIITSINTGVKRNVYAVFSTIGALESMVSSTWMGVQAPAKIEGTEVGNLIWATGNLIANGTGGCKIGAATDGGLYFQFGSLIGWKGGATGDGVGRAAKKNKSFYSGSSFNSTNEVSVVPKEYTGIGGLSQWPQDILLDNKLFFSHSGYGYNKSINEFPGFENGSLASVGVGDPCRYYLKGTWRLPIVSEFDTDLINSSITSNEQKGDWDVEGSTNSLLRVTLLSKPSVFVDFPSVGYRSVGSAGGMENVGMRALYHGVTTGYQNSTTLSYEFLMTSSSDYLRTYATPIRCVMNK